MEIVFVDTATALRVSELPSLLTKHAVTCDSGLVMRIVCVETGKVYTVCIDYVNKTKEIK